MPYGKGTYKKPGRPSKAAKATAKKKGMMKNASKKGKK